MRYQTALFVGAALVSGCSGREDVRITLPDPEGSRSLVLAVQPPEHGAQFFAFDLETESSPPAILSSNDDAEAIGILALSYDRSLGDLGMVEGPMIRSMGDRACLLPQAASVLQLSSDLTSWTEASVIPSWISAFQFEGPEQGCECLDLEADFSVETIALPTRQNPTFALDLINDSIMFGTAPEVGSSTVGSERRVFLLTSRDPDAIELTIPDGLPLRAATSGEFGDDGFPYRFGGEGGQIWRGEVVGEELRAEYVSTTSMGERIDWLDMDHVTGEMWALGRGGALEYFDGQSWSLLYCFDEPAERHHGGLIQLTRSNALAVFGTDPRAHFIRNGRLQQEEVGTTAGLIAVKDIAGLGIVVGDADGRFFVQREAGQWTPIGSADIRAFAMIEYETGFLYGGENGLVGQYRNTDPGFLCLKRYPLNPTTISWINGYSGGTLLIGDKASSDPTVSLRWLRRRSD